MKILITGAGGKLGKEVSKVYKALTPVRKEFDITNRKNVFDYVKKHKPDVIIHLAGLVPIRDCENNKELAWLTNVEGTRNIIDACAEFNKNCYFVYMSSPCIFSGEEGDYTEKSLPHPKNFYGLTKVVAETIILNSCLKKKLVIRANFIAKKRWPYPRAFTDRHSNYLFADDVAKAMKEALKNNFTGILHIVGDKKMSMFDLAKLTTADIKPMTMKDYSGPPLTVDMTMDTVRWKKFKISKVGKK